MKNYASNDVGGVKNVHVPTIGSSTVVVDGPAVSDQAWLDEIFTYYDSMANKVKMISQNSYEYMMTTKRNLLNLFRNLSKYSVGTTVLSVAGVAIVGYLALQLWKGLHKRRQAKSELIFNSNLLRKKYDISIPTKVHPKLEGISKILPDNFAVLKISRNPIPGLPDSFDVLAINENLNLKERELVYSLFNECKEFCVEYNKTNILEELLTTRVRGVSNGFDLLKEIDFAHTNLADLLDYHTILKKLEFNPGFLSLADLSALLYIRELKEGN